MRQLDALRAIAVGLVIVEHFGGSQVNAYIPISAGSLGVGCFFALSGFLITGILLESFDRHAENKALAWRIFYIRRAARLVPAYFLVLLVLVLFAIEPIASSWPWHAAYLTNVWIALGNPSNVFWTLAVEEQFYLLWPIVIALAPRRYLPAAAIGLIGLTLVLKTLIVLLGLPRMNLSSLLPLNFELLAMGSLLAIVSYRGGRANRFAWYEGRIARTFTIAAWTSIGLALASWAVLGEASLVRYFTNSLLCGVFFVWVILNAAIGFKGLAGRFLDNPWLQWMGTISYGLYLVHNWMPDIIERLIGPQPKVVMGPLALAATFAVCGLSWRYIEQPILAWARSRTSEQPVEAAEEVGAREAGPASAV
jgi:peptidoglycan/LPS O-acetylase OafA/YrhL